MVGADTLPDDLVERIGEIRVGGEPGVDEMYQFSLGQVAVENRVLDVAAVDAGEYRRFTEAVSAQFQQQWDRVAGGEMAVTDTLTRRLPVDKDGYVALAVGDRTHNVHVASYYPQVGTVDAVVNTAWADELDMVDGNALVISTGTASPQAVRKKLDALLEEDLSVHGLDAAAEYGLDPRAVQSVQLVGTFAEAVGVFRYTVLGGGRIAPDPAWVRSHIVTEHVPLLGEMTCNKHMMPQLRAAMIEIQDRGLADEIEYHVGCYYPRFIAGSTTLSNHSFGLAIDINSLENQRGTVGQMHPHVVEIMKKWGFAWGGDWKWTDPMHFELARIVEPRTG
ncbi:M15 family metallopeptidase [Nocardioides sp. TF02-7]|uniref:M15 family metallopeptidase n=1 Tax=Nocardioides sp. TF02-7 TaxID=2917724 RepID=UPI001F0696B1|nr:M15 family metallopeptidase [Nocardioides sp. TF02-7]UMG94069.1 M15 family metallopeptidase [Nocardioides sp. TF02-7]